MKSQSPFSRVRNYNAGQLALYSVDSVTNLRENVYYKFALDVDSDKTPFYTAFKSIQRSETVCIEIPATDAMIPKVMTVYRIDRPGFRLVTFGLFSRKSFACKEKTLSIPNIGQRSKLIVAKEFIREPDFSI